MKCTILIIFAFFFLVENQPIPTPPLSGKFHYLFFIFLKPCLRDSIGLLRSLSGSWLVLVKKRLEFHIFRGEDPSRTRIGQRERERYIYSSKSFKIVRSCNGDIRWQQMITDDNKWQQMTTDDIRWHPMTPDDIRLH